MDNLKSVYITYSDNVSWTLLENEVFIFDEMTDKIYILQEKQVQVWCELQNTPNLDELFAIGYLRDKDIFLSIIKKWINNNLVIVENEDETKKIV